MAETPWRVPARDTPRPEAPVARSRRPRRPRRPRRRPSAMAGSRHGVAANDPARARREDGHALDPRLHVLGRLSTRAFTSWDAIRRKLRGYDMLIMNVRSYTFPVACEAARIFKAVNPGGLVPGPREGLPVALGARMRVGPVAGRDGSHEPGVPVAVCVLQRELLHPEHGAPARRRRHRGAQCPKTAEGARRPPRRGSPLRRRPGAIGIGSRLRATSSIMKRCAYTSMSAP